MFLLLAGKGTEQRATDNNSRLFPAAGLSNSQLTDNPILYDTLPLPK
jgi:hypothetical protein